MGNDRYDEKTIVGFGDASSTTLEDIIPDVPPIAPLEVVFDRVTLDAAVPDDTTPYRALEVWTQNRVYFVDSTFLCVEVIDRRTGQADPKHSVLGTRLAGGQRKYGKTMHQAKPFPVPGTEAVFERPAARGRAVPASVTSKVERVVLHIRVTSVVLQQQNPWDDVTSALLQQSGPGRRGSDD
jgi:hypothetical protein